MPLLTTRFPPMVLDGHQEHIHKKVLQSAAIPQEATANPGNVLRHTEELRLPDPPEPDSHPARREWQAAARFEVRGYRELRATHLLSDLAPSQDDSPVVDGRGILPY